MKSKRVRKERLALKIKADERDCVVTASRERFKIKNYKIDDAMVRMLRFIWMRHLYGVERFKLHAGTLGRLARNGLVMVNATSIIATSYGEDVLAGDRK